MTVVALGTILNEDECCFGHTWTTLPPTVDAQFIVNNFETVTLLTSFHWADILQLVMFCMSVLGQSQRQ